MPAWMALPPGTDPRIVGWTYRNDPCRYCRNSTKHNARYCPHWSQDMRDHWKKKGHSAAEVQCMVIDFNATPCAYCFGEDHTYAHCEEVLHQAELDEEFLAAEFAGATQETTEDIDSNINQMSLDEEEDEEMVGMVTPRTDPFATVPPTPPRSSSTSYQDFIQQQLAFQAAMPQCNTIAVAFDQFQPEPVFLPIGGDTPYTPPLGENAGSVWNWSNATAMVPQLGIAAWNASCC